MYANIEEKYTLQEAREIIKHEEKEKRAKRLYFAKQKTMGVIMLIIGIIIPYIDSTCGMGMIVCVVIGLWLIFTKDHITNFDY